MAKDKDDKSSEKAPDKTPGASQQPGSPTNPLQGSQYPADAQPVGVPGGQPGTAPVTTDAANSTPTPPSQMTTPMQRGERPGGPIGRPSVRPGPGDDDDLIQDRGPRMAGRTRAETRESLGGGVDPRQAGDADETVRQLFGEMRQFITDVESQAWGQAVRDGMHIGMVFADCMDAGHFQVLRSLPAATSMTSEADSITRDLANCKNNVHTALASGRRVSWTGNPHPTSGAPAAVGNPVASGDPKAIDPQLILVVMEIVGKVWDVFQQWRNRG